jgi:hypothetical protein
MADPFDPKDLVTFKEMLVDYSSVITKTVSGGKAYGSQPALGFAIV